MNSTLNLLPDERHMMDWLGSGKYFIHLFAKGPQKGRKEFNGESE
jgi:hypothetical protein